MVGGKRLLAKTIMPSLDMEYKTSHVTHFKVVVDGDEGEHVISTSSLHIEPYRASLHSVAAILHCPTSWYDLDHIGIPLDLVKVTDPQWLCFGIQTKGENINPLCCFKCRQEFSHNKVPIPPIAESL